jgi:hypothetical protein
VPFVEVMMKYISVVREIWNLVLMVEDGEGWELRLEPSGKFRRV